MRLKTITSAGELLSLVKETGLLPLFLCGIEGYSVQECTPPEYWFSPDRDGPWEWRMELARSGEVAYAKLFDGKAGLVSMEWYPHLANYRRGGYDFDSLAEEGLAPAKLKLIMDVIEREGAKLSYELKDKTGLKGFESLITKLQMQTYVTVRRFDYRLDRHGKPYGWGIACYDLSERVFGSELVRSGYGTEPEKSFELLLNRMKELCPEAEESKLVKLLK